MSTIKNINIKTGESTYDSRDIGAEAEYVDVSRKADGTIVVDLDTETVASTESLAQTLKNIEDLDTVPTQSSTKGITSGAVYTATLADSALSPSSIKPVQNKVVTNALNEKVKRTVISSDVEAIGSASVGSYEEGQIFIATNGNAYKALEDIDAGDTLVENTNCEQTTLSEELKLDSTPTSGSNHPVTSDGIYNAISDVKDDLKDVWNNIEQTGCKNIFNYKIYPRTLYGITFTVDNDTLIANGTCVDHDCWYRLDGSELNWQYLLKKGDYILSGAPSVGGEVGIYLSNEDESVSAVDYGNGCNFTVTQDTLVNIGYYIPIGTTVNNIVIKPMITVASQSNSNYKNYKPYVCTNEQLTNAFENERQNGCINLLPCSMVEQVVCNVTFTKDADNIVTCTGTASGEVVELYGSVTLKPGSYIMSGVDGNYNGNYRLICARAGEPNIIINRFPVEVTFDTEQVCNIYIHVENGATVNTKFKPMITLANVPNSDYDHYVPYAMTNRELTKEAVGAGAFYRGSSADIPTSQITLFNCTGTISKALRYNIKGNYITISGRLIIDNMNRTGGNPGFAINFGKKLKLFDAEIGAYTAYKGASESWSNGKIRIGEILTAMCTSGDHYSILIRTTETYQNAPSDGKSMVYIIPPLVFEIDE